MQRCPLKHENHLDEEEPTHTYHESLLLAQPYLPEVSDLDRKIIDGMKNTTDHPCKNPFTLVVRDNNVPAGLFYR